MAGSFGTFQTAVGKRMQGQAMAKRAAASRDMRSGTVKQVLGGAVMATAPATAIVGPIVFAAGAYLSAIGTKQSISGVLDRGVAMRMGARARAVNHLITRARIANGAAIRADAAGAGAVGHYSRNAAAAGNLGDGMTDSYTRLSASGNAVQVAAYTTPKR